MKTQRPQSLNCGLHFPTVWIDERANRQRGKYTTSEVSP